MGSKEDESAKQLNGDELEFRHFAGMLGVEIPPASTDEDFLTRLNGRCDQEGNTLLMKAVELECIDAMEYFLRCDGIAVNVEKKKRKAIDIAWEKKNYKCVIMLLRKDSLFPDSIDLDDVDVGKFMGKDLRDLIERRVLLHDAIKNGTLNSVKEIAGKENSSTFYSPENETAISCAIEHSRYEIYAYLLSIDVRLGEEDKELFDQCDEREMEKFVNALEEYFIPDKNSHVVKLIAGTKLLGKFGKLERKAVKDIFHRLNDIELVNSLMKVLEHQEVNFVFDFNSKLEDRMCPKSSKDEFYGPYIPGIHRIRIGAMNCTLKREALDDVAGTVAHQLCHRAMYTLYDNYGNPYKKESNQKIVELNNLYIKISRTFQRGKKGEKKKKWEEVVAMYLSDPSDDELIVIVPHILGIYGEEKGIKILKSKLPDLYHFYSRIVNKDLNNYAMTHYFSSSLSSIKSLSCIYGIVQEYEKVSSPFNELIEYEEFLFKMVNVSTLLTSSVKLCTINLYHKLKETFPFHMEKQCLFIDLKDFIEYDEIFCKVLQCKHFHCLVLAAKEIDVDLDKVQDIIGEIEEDKRIILISEPKNVQNLQQSKVLRYHWENLRIDFQEEILGRLIRYQGREILLRRLTQGNLESEIINPKVLSYLLTKDKVSVGNMIRTESLWCSKDIYIPRTFVRYTFNRLSENLDSGSYYLFITGLKIEEAEKFGIKKLFVQEIEIGEEIQPNKYVIIPKTGNVNVQFFKECFTHFPETQEKTKRDSAHWLHFENGYFYLRYSKGSTDSILGLRKEELTKEEEIVLKMEKDRVVIVSDEAGAGKSTVISSMVDVVYKRFPEVFVARINLNEYAVDVTNRFSLHHIKKYSSSAEILQYFHEILRVKSCLEISLIECFQRRNNKVIVIFDSFDEIVPCLKNNVLKLLRTLLRETKINIWIFSRDYEKLDLELEMNACSHSLCPFSSHDQVTFLNKFWRFKIYSSDIENEEDKIRCKQKIDMMISVFGTIIERDPNSNILNSIKVLDELINVIPSVQKSMESRKDFSSKCKHMLDKVDFQDFSTFVLEDIKKIDKPLTSLPLHLYMMAEIIYNEDFKVAHHRNVFSLYFDFMESKIKTYFREKCCMTINTVDMNLVFNIVRVAVLRALTGLLDRSMDPDKQKDLSVKEDDATRVAQRIGLLKKEKGYLHFIHMSISKFVYSELIKEKIKSDNLNNELFSDLLYEDRYQDILRNLDGFFQTGDTSGVNFSKAFIRNFKVSDRFIDYLKHLEERKQSRTSDFVGSYVWKNILYSFEKGFGNEEFELLVLKIAEYLDEYFKDGLQRFTFLIKCLSERAIVGLLEGHASLTHKFMFHVIADANQKELSEIFRVLERMILLKDRECYGNKVSTGLQLFYLNWRQDYLSGHIFHWAARNKDENVFFKFLRLAERFMDKSTITKLLLEPDSLNRRIIHSSALNGNRNVLTMLEELENYLDEVDFRNLMCEEYNTRFNFLSYAAYRNNSPVYFKSLLEYLSEFDGGDQLRKLFLLEDTNNPLNVLHHSVMNGNKDVLEIAIKSISTYLQGEELEKFVSSRSYLGSTIYHIRSRDGHLIKDLEVLEECVSNEVLLELLTAVDSSGSTCVHEMCKSDGPTEVFVSNLCYIIRKLDESSLEKFILAVDEEGETFLHKLAEKVTVKDRTTFLATLEDKLPKSLFQKLTSRVNNKWKVVEIIKSDNNVSCRLKEFNLIIRLPRPK